MELCLIPYQICKLSYFSLGISSLVFIYALSTNLGDASFFLDPIASIFTIFLHTTLLWLDRRRKKRPPQSPKVYPISSLVPSIVCLWLLGFMWTVSSSLLIFNVVFTFLDGLSNLTRGLIIVEPLFAASEAILLLTIAVLCTKHRQTYQMILSPRTGLSVRAS